MIAAPKGSVLPPGIGASCVSSVSSDTDATKSDLLLLPLHRRRKLLARHLLDLLRVPAEQLPVPLGWPL
jgi:hypothetical protein